MASPPNTMLPRPYMQVTPPGISVARSPHGVSPLSKRATHSTTQPVYDEHAAAADPDACAVKQGGAGDDRSPAHSPSKAVRPLRSVQETLRHQRPLARSLPGARRPSRIDTGYDEGGKVTRVRGGIRYDATAALRESNRHARQQQTNTQARNLRATNVAGNTTGLNTGDHTIYPTLVYCNQLSSENRSSDENLRSDKTLEQHNTFGSIVSQSMDAIRTRATDRETAYADEGLRFNRFTSDLSAALDDRVERDTSMPIYRRRQHHQQPKQQQQTNHDRQRKQQRHLNDPQQYFDQQHHERQRKPQHQLQKAQSQKHVHQQEQQHQQLQQEHYSKKVSYQQRYMNYQHNDFSIDVGDVSDTFVDEIVPIYKMQHLKQEEEQEEREEHQEEEQQQKQQQQDHQEEEQQHGQPCLADIPMWAMVLLTRMDTIKNQLADLTKEVRKLQGV